MDQRIQIGIYDIGISIVNDITREEMLYVSLNKSKVIWTETKKSRVKPLSRDINTHLETLYQNHIEQCEVNPDDREVLSRKKYQMEGFRVEEKQKNFFLSSIICLIFRFFFFFFFLSMKFHFMVTQQK